MYSQADKGKAMVLPVVRYGGESWTIKKAKCQRIDAFKLWYWEDSWRSLGQQGDQTSQSLGKSTLNTCWKDWCWSWSSSTVGPLEKSLMLGKIEGRGEEGVRGWDGWMASPMQWIWTQANFMRWWGTGRPGVLQSMELQRVRHGWMTEQQLFC